MTLAEKLFQDGQRRGERRMLLRQLTKRFGAPSDAYRTRIQSADLSQLERWSLRLFDVDELDDVFVETVS